VFSDRINSPSTNSHPSTTNAVMNSPILGPTKLTTLPAATVQKIINEVLASKAADENAQSMSFAKETRDLLIECCVEFITMISTEANEIAEKDAKKTIACEHITKALEELGFGEYVQEIMAVADQFKTSQVVRISLPGKCRIIGSDVELTIVL
jgi:histone H3/H4